MEGYYLQAARSKELLLWANYIELAKRGQPTVDSYEK